MTDILVRHLERDRFRVEVRGHALDVDQPIADGGGDKAPTPTELFAASLASCVAFFAGRYLRRHDLPIEGLEVTCSFEMSTDRPARVIRIDVEVDVPAGVPPSRLAGLQAVIEHCTVHNSLTNPPAVSIRLRDAP